MAKKIRFPLQMDGGVEVRDVNSLRENFSLARVMGYFKDGKLVTWLRDRYANDLADAIEELDKESETFAKSICEILGVSYDEEAEEDIEKVVERNRKLSILQEYTSDIDFVDKVDYVAFEQDDIFDLLDEEVKIIYLCGEKFYIPLTKAGISYIGINNPVVVIDSKVEVNWSDLNINLMGIRYDDNYQAILDSIENTKRKLDVKIYNLELKPDHGLIPYKQIEVVDEDGSTIEIISDNAVIAIESDSFVYYFNDVKDETERKQWMYSRDAFKKSFKESPLWAFNKTTHEKIKLGVIDIYPYMSDRKFLGEDYNNILCCSDNWVVYKNCLDLYVCNVEKKEIRYFKFPGNNLIESGVIVGDWLCLDIPNERKLIKVNLKNFSVERFCGNGKKNELMGDIMTDQKYVYCFLGDIFNDASLLTIDPKTDEIIEKVGIESMYNRWIQNSFFYREIVYFTLKQNYSGIWECRSLNLRTMEQTKINQFDNRSINRALIERDDDVLIVRFKDVVGKELYTMKIDLKN